jgi:hypothetical protein
MYMSDLRHIHDPVLSSLKMEGMRLLFLLERQNYMESDQTQHLNQEGKGCCRQARR